MRRSSRALLVSALALALVGLPGLGELALRPMQVEQLRAPLAFAEDGGGAWVSEPLVGERTVAGLTWEDPADAPDDAEVRVRVDGEWLDWEHVEVDDEHAPDPGSAEDRAGRGGTAPIVVEGADAIQFRVTDAAAPRGLVADLVDVDDPDASRRGRARAGAADAAIARPTINGRDVWGGTQCLPKADEEPEYVDRVEVLFVHHTTGHTSYAQSDVASIVRGICGYHVNGRGWSDIGYNALIDRYGGIWEGRAGGLTEGVIGAHTGGFNSFSTGVAFIGDHSSATPTGPAQDALQRYARWMLDIWHVHPLRTTVLTSLGSSRWSEGTEVEFRSISGHRDASATACPGDACYALLNTDRPDDIGQRIVEQGGFKLYGGWPDRSSYELREDGTWPRPRIRFDLTHPADWELELTDPLGRVVWTQAGSGTEADLRWDARFNGARAALGRYTISIEAVRSSNGAGTNPAEFSFRLGGDIGDFEDVADSSVFADDVRWLAEVGVTLGCNPPNNTRFCPTDPVSREQMAAFLVRALELVESDHPGFLDVPAGYRFEQDIARFATADITRGCNPPDNTRYCPTASVTREQMAAFLHRALG